jgi:hypothetical protein
MRQTYLNYIEEKLSTLATRIKNNGKLNLLNLHQHSENFHRDLLNELFNWNLSNENETKMNVEAIDLIDHTNKIIIQVSATSSKPKIESSLSKQSLKDYKSYTFKFISIANDADNLRKGTFNNPYGINFNPQTDIIDTLSILGKIKGLEIDPLKKIYDFVKKELGGEIDVVKVESNLATIINILAKEDWDKTDPVSEIKQFEIDHKIEYNNLKQAVDDINDYSQYYGKLDKIYKEFDASGINKSISVLNAIASAYREAPDNLSDDNRFFHVFHKITEKIQKIQNRSNYEAIPIEELEMCVRIIVVDAFIKCKIFKNPSESYAAS